MAKATGLIFFIVRRCFSPRGAFYHAAVNTMHSSWAYQGPSFVSHSSLLTMKSVDFVVGTGWLQFLMSVIFIVAFLIAEVLLKQLLIV